MTQVRDPLLGAPGPALPANLSPTEMSAKRPIHHLHRPLHLSGGYLLLTWPFHPSQKRVRGDLPEATWPNAKGEGRDPGPGADNGP